jgi:hypothetical protein
MKWLRELTSDEAAALAARISDGVSRGELRKALESLLHALPKSEGRAGRPFEHPYNWAASILAGASD